MSVYPVEDLAIGCDHEAKVSGLHDVAEPSTYINNATILATIEDAAGATLVAADRLAIAYVSASNGDYRGTIPAAALAGLTPGATYWERLEIWTAARATGSITAATAADPVVITSTAHGRSNGDVIVLRDLAGMVELNGNAYRVANKTDDTFELTDPSSGAAVDGSAFTAYTSGGTWETAPNDLRRRKLAAVYRARA